MRAIHGRGRGAGVRPGDIVCDVLDAWFDPHPAAVAAFAAAACDLNSSPPTGGEPLIEAISRFRGIPAEALCLGAGSSEIIHRVLSKVCGGGNLLLVDPTYSEYSFAAEQNSWTVERFELKPEEDFRIDLDMLTESAQKVQNVVLVNPNNPTGQVLSREEVLRLRQAMRSESVLWVDEAYVDYAPSNTSVELEAAILPGLVVLKSLSKAYALSGVRAAYLVAEPSASAEIRKSTPPWIVSTAAIYAAKAALAESSYYEERWRESHEMVQEFAGCFESLGLKVYRGWINAVLVECPSHLRADEWVCRLSKMGLHVRTPAGMGLVLGDRFIRIGLVKRALWPRLVATLHRSLSEI